MKMIFKGVALALLMLGVVSMTQAQKKRKPTHHHHKKQGLEYMHGVGATYTYVVFDDSENGSGINGAAGVTYNPRLVLVAPNKNLSVTAEAYPTLVFNMNFDSQAGSSGSFGYEIPVSINGNVGHQSTLNSDAGFGWTLGAGFGHSNITNSSDAYSTFGADRLRTKTTGLFLTTGPKWETGRGTDVGVHLYSILGGSQATAFGIRALYLF